VNPVIRARLAALCAATAIFAAGCTSAPTDPTVATAAQPTATAYAAASASPAKETDYDQALRFTRCMNALGETIPDPVEGQALQLASKKLGDWYTPSDNFPKCKQYLPATWPVKMDPKALAKEAKFDDCLRKRGIPVPEPDSQGMVHYSTDPGYWETPEYRAAEDACRYLYDDAANNQ